VGGAGLILADEPTGNLDVENVRIIADCLTEEARRGRIIVIATHDPALLKLGTQSLRMEHGHLVAPESEPDGKL